MQTAGRGFEAKGQSEVWFWQDLNRVIKGFVERKLY